MRTTCGDRMPNYISKADKVDALTIREIVPGDAAAIAHLQNLSPEASQWIAAEYEALDAHGYMGWAAEYEGEIAGFIVVRRLVSDLEILNIAVHPKARRKGIASELLRYAFWWGQGARTDKAILEVRESNAAGLNFYTRHGFRVAGRRHRYYQQPEEDALLLIAPIPCT